MLMYRCNIYTLTKKNVLVREEGMLGESWKTLFILAGLDDDVLVILG